MKSKTNTLALCLLMFSVSIFAQYNSPINKGIQDGYNKKFVATTEKKWDKKRIDAFVVTNEGNTYQGQLLHMNDNTLFLYTSDSMFYKNPDGNLIYSFSSDEIIRIVLKRHTRIGEGVFAGAVAAVAAPIYATVEFIGSGEEGWLVLLIPALYLGSAMMTVPIGITAGYLYGVSIDYQTNGDSESFKTLAEELKKYTLFKDTIPGKFLPVNEVYKQTTDNEVLRHYKERKKDLLDFNKLDVGVFMGAVTSAAATDFNNNIKKSLSQDFYKSSDSYLPIFGFEIGYRLHKNIRVGFEISGWNYSTTYEDYNFISYEDPYTSFWFDYTLTSFALKCDYIYKPVRRLMSRRSEFSFGIGASTNSMYSIFSESYYSNNNYIEPTDIEPDPLFNSHLHAAIAYDLYIFRFLSARVALNGQYAIKEIETEEIKLLDVNNTEHVIPGTRINTSSVSAEFGLRLHF